jgi:hypothetical protein
MKKFFACKCQNPAGDIPAGFFLWTLGTFNSWATTENAERLKCFCLGLPQLKCLSILNLSIIGYGGVSMSWWHLLVR